MNWPLVLAISVAALLVVLATIPTLRRNPRGTLGFGLALAVARLHVRLLHRLRVDGREHLADLDLSRGLIVVANHTAGVDPVLLQAALPFQIRWMMARDMADPRLDRFWGWLRVIRVDRTAADPRSLLTAVRHVRQGGVLGLFPEGFLERPPRQLRHFRPGVGLLVARCGCQVLPVVIEGTPQFDPAWASLFRLSRSRLRILPPLKADHLPNYPDEIRRFLEEVFVEATGWAIGEEPGAARPAGRAGVLRALTGRRVDEP